MVNNANQWFVLPTVYISTWKFIRLWCPCATADNKCMAEAEKKVPSWSSTSQEILHLLAWYQPKKEKNEKTLIGSLLVETFRSNFFWLRGQIHRKSCLMWNLDPKGQKLFHTTDEASAVWNDHHFHGFEHPHHASSGNEEDGLRWWT